MRLLLLRQGLVWEFNIVQPCFTTFVIPLLRRTFVDIEANDRIEADSKSSKQKCLKLCHVCDEWFRSHVQAAEY